MNTKDWIVSSDIAAGITSTVLNKLSCKGLSNANMWKPLVESLSLSVLGRLTSSWFSGKMFSSGTDEKPYVKTDEGRSALVIFISSLIISYIMKQKNMYENAAWNVSADVVGSQITQAIFSQDIVWFARSSA